MTPTSGLWKDAGWKKYGHGEGKDGVVTSYTKSKGDNIHVYGDRTFKHTSGGKEVEYGQAVSNVADILHLMKHGKTTATGGGKSATLTADHLKVGDEIETAKGNKGTVFWKPGHGKFIRYKVEGGGSRYLDTSIGPSSR